MRTITENFLKRLNAQTQEAKIQGLSKIASQLDTVIKDCPTRKNDESYTYSYTDFKNDVENLLWKIAIRSADFYGGTIDAVQVDDTISKVAALVIDSMRHITSSNDKVIGANEPNIPGEIRKSMIIEVEEE